MGIKEEDEPQKNCTIGDFYNSLQLKIISCNEEDQLCHITSRSTVENKRNIENVCNTVQYNCQRFCIPMEGTFLKKTELSVKAFKYFICNTKFNSQSLLADDTANGHLVDMHPPYSVYLLIEIVWYCKFEDILAESILHFPLDICVEILEVLPRCIDLLDFERAARFLTTIIPNSYKKLIILRDTGCQVQDVTQKASTFSAHVVELILQFMNTRFLKFEDVPKEEKFKRLGRLLKSIIQMVRLCLTIKIKKVEHPVEMEKLYKLTFGHAEFHKINDELLQKLFLNMDCELISLLTKKVKEIDCNIYMDWMEYDDQENTGMTLQRAIGLESYLFIEHTKDHVSLELKDYNHLIEYLGQLASKPENATESMQLEDLAYGVAEGKREYLLAIFKRYKEWNDSIVDSVDSHISLLTKDDCEHIFEYLSDEIVSQIYPEKLQTCLLCLSKALIFLDITELYEITVKFIVKFNDNDNLENVIDITNFERFISLNPNLSASKNLRVVLFFLCLKPKATLKILVKMAIGHVDYPDVAISIDDLMLLEPIMKIQTQSRYDTLIDVLRYKCSETAKPIWKNPFYTPKKNVGKPASVSLVLRILQDICLDAAEWNYNKFGSFMKALYTFCSPTEFIWEIFVPFLLSDRCTIYQLYYILVELQKFISNFNTKYRVTEIPKIDDTSSTKRTDCHLQNIDKNTAYILNNALIERGIWLLNSVNISRYIVSDCLSIIQSLMDHLIETYYVSQSHPVNYYSTISTPISFFIINKDIANQLHRKGAQLKVLFDSMTVGHKKMICPSPTNINYPMRLVIDDLLRFIMTKCSKKNYLEYTREMITTCNITLRQSTSKHERCDWIVRLTFETCLLCLEFPMIAPVDSVSFLLQCLNLFLSSVINTQKKLDQKLCDSLDKHLEIIKPVAPFTVISDAFNELVLKYAQLKNDLAAKIKALEVFALSCTAKNDKLKNYEGVHSPLGIKLYLAHGIVTMSMDENLSHKEKYIEKLTEYLKKPEET
ncbi:uncharacterized protein LOC131674907 isoform X2 [Phymastichus coffea]|nr:uncharacterized protein LOC131670896 isoform X2 [Phymastichus coffea]XP_058809700.1 uncharacterized protein LOC131674907 isoform X2 [Phymastichus coffea]